MTLTTVVGEVAISAAYGQDRRTRQWLSPIRELWGLWPHQAMSPALEEKVCYTAAMTFSYEHAAAVAAKWGSPVDDAAIHRHVQVKGMDALALENERVLRALSLEHRAEVVAEAKRHLPRGEFSLVIMMDGTMLRERGPDWGLKPSETQANRVAWHELKGAIVYRLSQRAESQSGRGMILEKYCVAYRGEPFEFGQRVYAEALRRGLNQAKKVYVVADGAVWIWNIVADRFPQAQGGLDFYHASEHLWAVAHDQFGESSPQARAWIEPLLHQLKHGGEFGVLQTLEDFCEVCAEGQEPAHPATQREIAYFRQHRDHLHYEQLRAEGCPIGSGAMESTCSQFQDRFKRTGQIWSLSGEQCLMALDIARRNNDWDEIWAVDT
ncbi:MAG: UPF0236 family protein [Candidatus Sumerlaeota bacterium]|nr:UPF0236 family protein [Candidatus Sumerlaeota bacterium]